MTKTNPKTRRAAELVADQEARLMDILRSVEVYETLLHVTDAGTTMVLNGLTASDVLAMMDDPYFRRAVKKEHAKRYG